MIMIKADRDLFGRGPRVLWSVFFRSPPWSVSPTTFFFQLRIQLKTIIFLTLIPA